MNQLLLGAAVWSCEAAEGSHRPVLQQGAAVHGSSSVQEVPEDGGSGAALSRVRLPASRRERVLPQRSVGLEAPGEGEAQILFGVLVNLQVEEFAS